MITVLIAVELVVLAATLLIMRAAESKRQRRTLVAYQLKFPRGLEAEGVEAFLGGLSGLLLPWWKRWLVSPYVSIEVHASPSGIRHFLLVPRSWGSAVEGLLQASMPSVRYESVDLPFAILNIGAEYALSDHRRPVRTNAACQLAAVATGRGHCYPVADYPSRSGPASAARQQATAGATPRP
jgi:hypothetical protein